MGINREQTENVSPDVEINREAAFSTERYGRSSSLLLRKVREAFMVVSDPIWGVRSFDWDKFGDQKELHFFFRGSPHGVTPEEEVQRMTIWGFKGNGPRSQNMAM